MTDKEVRAIAIKEVTYADMIAIGATEEIAKAASWKARCAFEASWDCAVDKACEWLREHLGAPAGIPQAKSYNDAINELTTEFRKGMEE